MQAEKQQSKQLVGQLEEATAERNGLRCNLLEVREAKDRVASEASSLHDMMQALHEQVRASQAGRVVAESAYAELQSALDGKTALLKAVEVQLEVAHEVNRAQEQHLECEALDLQMARRQIIELQQAIGSMSENATLLTGRIAECVLFVSCTAQLGLQRHTTELCRAFTFVRYNVCTGACIKKVSLLHSYSLHFCSSRPRRGTSSNVTSLSGTVGSSCSMLQQCCSKGVQPGLLVRPGTVEGSCSAGHGRQMPSSTCKWRQPTLGTPTSSRIMWTWVPSFNGLLASSRRRRHCWRRACVPSQQCRRTLKIVAQPEHLSY